MFIRQYDNTKKNKYTAQTIVRRLSLKLKEAASAIATEVIII